MSVPTNNDIHFKEYYERSKYKNLEIEIEKMWNFKTAIMPLLVGSMAMIRKEIDQHINKIPCSRSFHEIQKLHWTEKLIFLGEHYQCD